MSDPHRSGATGTSAVQSGKMKGKWRTVDRCVQGPRLKVKIMWVRSRLSTVVGEPNTTGKQPYQSQLAMHLPAGTGAAAIRRRPSSLSPASPAAPSIGPPGARCLGLRSMPAAARPPLGRPAPLRRRQWCSCGEDGRAARGLARSINVIPLAENGWHANFGCARVETQVNGRSQRLGPIYPKVTARGAEAGANIPHSHCHCVRTSAVISMTYCKERTGSLRISTSCVLSPVTLLLSPSFAFVPS